MSDDRDYYRKAPWFTRREHKARSDEFWRAYRINAVKENAKTQTRKEASSPYLALTLLTLLGCLLLVVVRRVATGAGWDELGWFGSPLTWVFDPFLVVGILGASVFFTIYGLRRWGPVFVVIMWIAIFYALSNPL